MEIHKSMNKVTIYSDLKSKEPHHITVGQALGRIKNGKSKVAVEKIRSGGDGLKTSLPAVIFSGVVVGDKRRDEDVTEHSSYFCLDFDHLEDPTTKIAQLKSDPYIFAAWLSPSGDGVKALVKCTPSLEKHREMYTAFCERYPKLDTTSKNEARLCFESYDPDLYYNPHCKTWERTKTEAEVASERAERKDRRNVQLLGKAVAMVRTSWDGEKHDQLLKASRLLGGYVAAGRIDEQDAITTLVAEIAQKEDVKDLRGAKKTILDGINYGKRAPLHEAKKIEKAQEFLKRDDGTYDFLADRGEMATYEQSVIDGTLAVGQSSNIPVLDRHWMFKYNSLDWFGGLDNSGKSFVLWYLAVLEAMFNGVSTCMASFENNDGEVQKKLKEFYTGKPLAEMTPTERDSANKFIDTYFIIISSKKLYTWEELLITAEVIYDEVLQFDLLVAEPFNAMDIPSNLDEHRHNLKATNMLREFKENIATVWVADHVNSAAGRNRDSNGFVRVPWKAEISGGQIKANKADSFIIVHRVLNDPDRKYTTELHVQKIRSKETGGEPTDIENPVNFEMNQNYCGYTCAGIDPVKDYWARKEKGITTSLPPAPAPQAPTEDNASSRLGHKWPEETEAPPF